MQTTLALSGDAIINRRISTCEREGFLALVEQFRKADIGFTHLETVIHEFDRDDAYPAAEAGGTWMASPEYVADELAWAGIDVVSHASNHALDYSYGALANTWEVLDRSGIAHAGTGENLGDARAPAYFQIPEQRVALVSMSSSYPRWSRAGQSRPDVIGRPGVNPLRYHHVVDTDTKVQIQQIADALGWWINDAGDGALELNPAGLHNTRLRIEEADGRAETTVPHEGDLKGNLRAISDAATQADFVIAHLHTHEFQPGGDVGDPADFVSPVSKACIDAGADVFVVQGTHSPIRGIELYKGRPIFHDPGDFFRMNDTVERLPADFYDHFEDGLPGHPADATPSEGFTARKGGSGPGADTPWLGVINPPGGSMAGSETGNVLPVCTFEDGELSRIEVYPGYWPADPSAANVGIPERATGDVAERIIDDIAEKSAAYGTDVRFEDGRGVISAD
ncbi:hypothetical protein C2R22_24220 (plasmid) [Salinigranum rubrum]|uniref:Capsule synthesis protein CapA domain-containing protein n=1 Tax=Salinigranum rubrum TaxID=755307 RepID=A0A2I8VTX5_9EURY|nr:CapA family protein [Salinigranum rubrum]AUV84639.1 hypothetical protein C2R22_24220 [Salinigranum rubrum]